MLERSSVKIPAAGLELNLKAASPPSTKVTLTLKHEIHLTLANDDAEKKNSFLLPELSTPFTNAVRKSLEENTRIRTCIL